MIIIAIISEVLKYHHIPDHIQILRVDLDVVLYSHFARLESITLP